jgi:MFS family permease
VNATPDPPAASRKADLERSLDLCVRDGFAAMPIVTMSLPVNVFLTALVTKAWVLPKPAIGLLTAMPFLANFVQVFAVPAITRWRPAKTLTVLAATANLLCWIAFAFLLGAIPRDQPELAARWFIGWFFVASVFGAVSGVTWNAWVQEWVPARLRGKYFGRRNRLLQISVLLFLFVTGWVLARWDYAVPAFQAVIAGAAVLRIASIYWQWKSPTRAHRPVPAVALSFRAQAGVLRRSHSLLWFIAFGAVWSFAANCFGPFYQVFLFEQLGLSAFDVGILSTVSALGGALSLPAWGRLLDRYGNRPVMAFSLLVWQGVNLLWCLLEPNSRTIVYIIWALGGMTSMGAIASAGFVLGQFTILLRLLPVEAKSLAIGLNLAVTSLAAAIAPVVGGAVLQAALARWTDALLVYHVAFLVQPAIAIAGCMLLLKVHEPQASSLTMVFGAMRNIRTLSGVLGLEFLVNYVFYRAEKKRP